MKTITALIVLNIILINQNSFSQKEFLSLKENVINKIQFDNYSNTKTDQTIISPVFEAQLTNVLRQSKISLFTQNLTYNNFNYFNYINHFKTITFHNNNDSRISNN